MKFQVVLCVMCAYQCIAGPLPASHVANTTQDLSNPSVPHRLVKRTIIDVPGSNTCEDIGVYLPGTYECVSCDVFPIMVDSPCTSVDFKESCSCVASKMCESTFTMPSGDDIECFKFHNELEDFPCEIPEFVTGCENYHKMINLCE